MVETIEKETEKEKRDDDRAQCYFVDFIEVTNTTPLSITAFITHKTIIKIE